MGMPMVFRPQVAPAAQARIQFHVQGSDPGSYWLRIAGGKCESFEGLTESPDLTIRTPEDVWVRIAHRELDPEKALTDGLYQIEGDALLFVKFGEWFGGGR
jgi:putative sterol carrier protein